MTKIAEQLAFATKGGDLLTRPLNDEERRIAKQVFEDTLNLSRVSLAAGIGLDDRMWTEPNWDARIYTLGLYQAHIIHVGPGNYVLGMQSTPYSKHSLVHELTHVWQAQVGDGYLLEAGWHQLVDKSPYLYTPGDHWEAYSVEQQAQIVEDWYEGGAQEDGTSALFPYIRDVIRAPQAPTIRGSQFHPYHR